MIPPITIDPESGKECIGSIVAPERKQKNDFGIVYESIYTYGMLVMPTEWDVRVCELISRTTEQIALLDREAGEIFISSSWGEHSHYNQTRVDLIESIQKESGKSRFLVQFTKYKPESIMVDANRFGPMTNFISV